MKLARINNEIIEILVLGLLHGVLHIYQSVLPPIYLLIQEEFQVSTLQLGLFGSVTSITSVFQGAAGYLAEKTGRKKLTLIGMLVYSIALFFFSQAPSFNFLLFLIAIAGIGGSTFHPSTYSLVAEKARQRHVTKSIAYHQFGGFLGGAFGIALIGVLAQSLGWRNTVQLLIIPGLAITTLFWILVSEEKTVKKENLKAVNNEFKITLPLLIIVLYAFSHAFGSSLRFLPMFLSLEYGESVAWAGILTGIMQGVGCASLIIGGIMADLFDKVWIISGFTFLTGVSTMVLATGSFSSEILLLILVFMGFVQYFSGPAMHALITKISGTSPKGIGLEFAGIALGGIFGAPLAGYLIDAHGIRFAFIVLSAFTLLSSSVILLLKVKNYKNS